MTMAVGVDWERLVVEMMIGRNLRPAERVIDVRRLNLALNRAKDDLARAIRAEMVTATRRWGRGLPHGHPLLAFTDRMREPLDRLEQLGRREARAELDRLGIPVRAFRAPRPNPRIRGMQEVYDTVAAGLPDIGVRIGRDVVHADLTDLSAAAIARALLAIPGARDIASQVVSTALYSGMGSTFEEHEDLVAGWEYSAVMDAATCEECEPLDGEQFPSWAAIQDVLPGGGPNPECFGGGRCRCRAVPLG